MTDHSEGLFEKPLAPRRPITRWILLRGLARQKIHWGDFVHQLERIFPDFQFLAIDTNGNGERAKEPAFSRLEDSVEDLRERTRNFRQDRPVGLLTISLGGMLATSWATKYPHDVGAMVAINTSLAGLSPFYHRMRPLGLLHLLLSTFKSPLEGEKEILKATTTSFRTHPEKFEKYLEVFARAPRTGFRSALVQLGSAARFRAPPKAPAVPILLLCALGDHLVHPDCTRKLAGAWGIRARYHEWGGHDLPLDDAGWICRELADWLGQKTTSR